jgi:hypothetical protein
MMDLYEDITANQKEPPHMTDADEKKPPSPERAYNLRQRERGFALIKIWVPEAKKAKFYKDAAVARAVYSKKAATA